MSVLVWGKQAQHDLRAILDFYQEFGNDVPVRLIAAIDRAAIRLLDHPRLGAALPDSGVRVWQARGTPFLLLYRPTRDGVRILQVRHGATDWKPHG